MSHHQPQTGMMPPDSHAVMRNNTSSPTSSSSSPSDNTTPTPSFSSDPSALLTLMAIGPTPTPTPPPSSVPGGILGKGHGLKKRVSFRDNLVSVREIPPRPHRRSSSEDDGEDEDDSDEGEDSGSSVSDDDSGEDSESEEEEEEEGKRGVRRHAGTVTAGGKALTVSCRSVAKNRTSPTNSSLTPSSPRARVDRTHVPTSAAAAANASNVTSAKGSYHVTSSPTSRVISIVSQITGVSSVATQTHIKQRSKAAATMAKSATASPKQVTAVLRVEKKVKRISPNLDSASSPQTVRAVQNKDGAPTMAAAVGKGGPGKCAKKKRVSIRKQDAVEKRKPATFRKTKEMKNTAKVGSSENVNGTVAGPVKYKFVVNALSTVRDSLSLPPLGGGGGGGGEHNNNNTPLLTAAKTLQPHAATRVKTPIFSVDGFIFPGDLATGVKVKNTTGKAEDTKLTLPVPRSTRERWTRTPPGSPGRRKRCHAWQMANGDLESSLQEPPSITPMWETVTPMGGHSTTTTTTTATTSSPPLSSRGKRDILIVYTCQQASKQVLLLLLSGQLTLAHPHGHDVEVNLDHESHVYFHVLDDHHYIKHLRPAASLNESVIVEMDLALLALLRLFLKWEDPRLHWNSTDNGGVTDLPVPSSALWTPDLALFTSVLGSYKILNGNNAILHHDGVVTWLCDVMVNFHCPIDLSKFPFDSHTCVLQLEPDHVLDESIHLHVFQSPPGSVMDSSKVHVDTSIAGEWAILANEIRTSPSEHGVEVRVEVGRQSRLYQCLLVAPVVLLALLVPCVFLLPPPSTAKITLGGLLQLSLCVCLRTLCDTVHGAHGSIPSIAMFGLASMALNSISILMAALIMSLASRRSTTKPIPAWISTIFLGPCGLRRCLCLDPYPAAKERHPPFASRRTGNDHNTEADADVTSLRGGDSTGDVKEMASNLRGGTGGCSPYGVQEGGGEWGEVARVLDRVFFVLYVMLFVLLCVSLLS
ncbi:hypothetical protein ACOMHN_002320 [Nucella lapillus]